MPKTTNKKSNNKKLARTPRWPIYIAIFTVLLVVTIGTLPSFIPNSSLKQEDKNAVERDISNILNLIKVPGEPVYQDLKDLNCKQEMPRYFERITSCSFIAQKYFKFNGDIHQTLISVRQQLATSGFNETKIASATEPTTSLDPKKPLYFTIQQSSRTYEVRLGHYRDDKNYSDADAQLRRLIDDGTLPAPSQNEYYYGVLLTHQYYFCSAGNNWPEGPCPTPPSDLQ
jgi:hypothetical protein